MFISSYLNQNEIKHELTFYVGFERKVQRMPVTLPASPSLTAFWKWEEAQGSLVLYNIAATVDIEQAFQQSAAKSVPHFNTCVDLSKCPSRLPYTINFFTMEQTRHSYGTKRKIQRVPLMDGNTLQNLLQSTPVPMPTTTKSSRLTTAYCSSNTSPSVPSSRFNFGASMDPTTAGQKASATGVGSPVNRTTDPIGGCGRSTHVPSSVSISNVRVPHSANISGVPGSHAAGISGVPGPRSTGISGVPGPCSSSMSSDRVPSSFASSKCVHSMWLRSSTRSSSSPHINIVPSCASSSGSHLTSHLPNSTSSGGVHYAAKPIVTSTSGISHSNISGSSGSSSLKKKPSKTSKSSNSPLGRADWKAKGKDSYRFSC